MARENRLFVELTRTGAPFHRLQPPAPSRAWWTATDRLTLHPSRRPIPPFPAVPSAGRAPRRRFSPIDATNSIVKTGTLWIPRFTGAEITLHRTATAGSSRPRASFLASGPHARAVGETQSTAWRRLTTSLRWGLPRPRVAERLVPLPRAVSIIPAFPLSIALASYRVRAGPSFGLGSKPAPACSAENASPSRLSTDASCRTTGTPKTSVSRWHRDSFPQTTHHRRRFPEPKRLPPMNPCLTDPACARPRPSRHWYRRLCRRDPASWHAFTSSLTRSR